VQGRTSARDGHLPRGRRGGFALLEVLVALLLLAFGAAGAAAGFTLALRGQHAAAGAHLALALAADAGERLRAVAAGARGAEAQGWEIRARERLAPGAAPGFDAVLAPLDGAAAAGATADAWRLRLQWHDRLGLPAREYEARLDVGPPP
jgi:Tfp pilus assembly protein PilV